MEENITFLAAMLGIKITSPLDLDQIQEGEMPLSLTREEMRYLVKKLQMMRFVLQHMPESEERQQDDAINFKLIIKLLYAYTKLVESEKKES